MKRSNMTSWVKDASRGPARASKTETTDAEPGWYARSLVAAAWGPYPAVYTDPLPVVSWSHRWYQGDDIDAAPDRSCTVQFPDGGQATISSSMVEVYRDDDVKR